MDIAQLDRDLTGTATGPDSPAWDSARQAWNLAVDQHPAAVAEPADAGDVAAVVRFAAANGLRVTAQGTGHAAATHDTLADTVLVKTSALRSLSVDPEARTARIGAGVLAGELADAAGRHGLAPLGGSSTDVGVVGYSLGGGLGWLGRLHGFAGNGLRAVELVTATGEQVRADAGEHPDLFWALRGGGGSFGIVTAVELGLHEVGEVFAGDVLYDAVHAPEVFRAYRDWAAGVGDEISSGVRFLTPPALPDVPEPIRGRPLVTVTAAHAGDPAEGEAAIAPLRALAEPVLDGFGVVPAAALCRIHGDPESPVPGIGGSSTVLADLPDAAIDTLVELAGPESGSPLLSVDLRHLGGALGRAAEGAGVLDKLDGEFAVAAIGVPVGPNTPEAITAHLGTLARGLELWRTGIGYLNFNEVPSDGSTHFAPEAYARLRQVKRDYDPDAVIRGGHDVPPA